MMPSGEAHEARLRIGREGISRTLTDRLRLRDNPRGAGGLYVSTLAHMTIDLDKLLDRPQIQFYTSSVTGNTGGTPLTVYTVGGDTQEELVAIESREDTGTFDYRLSIQPSARDGGTNMRIGATSTTGSDFQLIWFNPGAVINPGWALKAEITNFVGAGNLVVRVWKKVRVWMHYDEE